MKIFLESISKRDWVNNLKNVATFWNIETWILKTYDNSQEEEIFFLKESINLKERNKEVDEWQRKPNSFLDWLGCFKWMYYFKYVIIY